MEKKNKTNKTKTDSPKTGKMSDNRKKLLMATVGLFLSIIGGLLCHYCNIGSENETAKKQDIVIKTQKEAEGYLSKNSNYSSDKFKEFDFNSYWPQEYFEIDLDDKMISYWKDTLVAKVEYGNYSLRSIKVFKNDSVKKEFEKFPKNLGNELKDYIKQAYCEEIDKASIDEAVKDLSILYNALAGHPESYILLGRKDEGSSWIYYQPTDFPTYTMPAEDDIIALANKYVSDSAAKATPLCDAFLATVNCISVKAVSFDFRGDTIYFGDDRRSIKEKKLPAQYKLDTLNKISACGWVVLDGKEELEKARDFYGSRHFIDENVYEQLKELKWNNVKTEQHAANWLAKVTQVFFYMGLAFLCIGVLLLIFLAMPYVIRFLKKRSKKQTKEDEQDDEDEEEVDDKDKSKDNGDILRLKQEINKFKEDLSKAIENFKKSEEYKALIKEAKSAAVKDYKNSEEFKRVIDNAEAEGVKKIKNSKEYEKLTIEAGNWNKYLSCTTEDKVISFLNETHKKISNFPKINTLNNIYSDAKDACKTDEKIIEVIINALDKQVGKPTGLQTVYEKIVENAKYAIEVRERFESCKEIANQFGERNEYRQIVSQGSDLTLWERLAVMLWAIECTNKILIVFGKKHLAANILENAAMIHKEDIMQIFAVRIFNKFIADTTAPIGALIGSREKMMKDKLAEMQSKYGVSMQETPKYKDFVEDLDSIHDKIKANAAFVNIMKAQFVDEFVNNEIKITDKGKYLSYLVAMGLHMSDYVRYMNGNDIDYCPNLKFVLSGLNPDSLDSDTEFRYKDPAYSGEYSNRIYEWLKDDGVDKLKALVGNKYIMP